MPRCGLESAIFDRKPHVDPARVDEIRVDLGNEIDAGQAWPDIVQCGRLVLAEAVQIGIHGGAIGELAWQDMLVALVGIALAFRRRSEEHTSALQSLMRNTSYVFYLKK